MHATLQRREIEHDGIGMPEVQYVLTTDSGRRMSFDLLNDAMEFCDEQGIVVDGPLALGYRLGTLAVGFASSGFSDAQVYQGLDESTDRAWSEAAKKLADLLVSWAEVRR